MECVHCGTKLFIWQLDDSESFIYPNKCPFCGRSMSEISQNIAIILRQIIKKNGNEILRNRKVLSAYISDLLYEDSRKQKTLKIAVGEGVGDFFYDMIGADNNRINILKSKTYKFITEDIGMTEERAKIVLETFLYAIGLTNRIEGKLTKKEYCDGEDIYLGLAEDYWKKNKKDKAKALFYLSATSGNIKAVHRVIELGRKHSWDEYKEDYVKWHKILSDREEDNLESTYLVAMSYTFGLSVDKNIEEAEKYWHKYWDRTEECSNCLERWEISLEHDASKLIQEMYGAWYFRYNQFHNKVCRLVGERNGFQYTYKTSGFLKVSCVYHRYWRVDNPESLEERDYYEQAKCRVAMVMYHFYERKIQKRLKEGFYCEFNYGLIQRRYLEEIENNLDAVIEGTKKMMNSNWLDSKIIGFEFLSVFYQFCEIYPINLENEISHCLGEEYLKGVAVEKDENKTNKLIYNAIVGRDDYLLGLIYYNGWGVEPDLQKAIYNFEAVVEENRLYGYNMTDESDVISNMRKNRVIAETIPLLIECYYEDLLINDSVRSLEKLEIIAEYWEWKQAARYLYWYYMDKDNIYQCDITAKRYKDILCNIMVDSEYIKDSRKIDAERIAMSYWLMGLFGSTEKDKKIEPYFYFAKAFANGRGVKKNFLRAEIYIRIYIELSTRDNDELYRKALKMYADFLVKYSKNSYRYIVASEYLNSYEEKDLEDGYEEFIRKTTRYGLLTRKEIELPEHL